MSPNTFYPDKLVLFNENHMHYALSVTRLGGVLLECHSFNLHRYPPFCSTAPTTQLSPPWTLPHLSPSCQGSYGLARGDIVAHFSSLFTVLFFFTLPLLNPSKWLGGKMWVRTTVWCSVFMAQGFMRLSAGPWARLNVQAALLAPNLLLAPLAPILPTSTPLPVCPAGLLPVKETH